MSLEFFNVSYIVSGLGFILCASLRFNNFKYYRIVPTETSRLSVTLANQMASTVGNIKK